MAWKLKPGSVQWRMCYRCVSVPVVVPTLLEPSMSNDEGCVQGHWEKPPYDNSSMRSAYHIRELDVYRLLQIHRPLDIFLSHDWPRGIANFGNKAQLFRAKPFLQKEVKHTCMHPNILSLHFFAHQPSKAALDHCSAAQDIANSDFDSHLACCTMCSCTKWCLMRLLHCSLPLPVNLQIAQVDMTGHRSADVIA